MPAFVFRPWRLQGCAMTPETFRAWLRDRGCSFDKTERGRGEGPVAVVVRRGPRRSLLPDASSHADLKDEDVRRVVTELDLPYDELPGPQGRR